MNSKLILVFLSIICALNFKIECSSNLQIYAYIGKPLSLRCYMNETTKFTRINHVMPNGTSYTLLSNEIINQDLLKNSEIKIQRHKTHYEVFLNPVRKTSAGLYTCEDDVSLMDQRGHFSNITLHVINNLDEIDGDLGIMAPFLLPIDLEQDRYIPNNANNETNMVDDDDAEDRAVD